MSIQRAYQVATSSVIAFTFIACCWPSKPAPAKLNGDEDLPTLTNYAKDDDEFDTGADRWQKHVAR